MPTTTIATPRTVAAPRPVAVARGAYLVASALLVGLLLTASQVYLLDLPMWVYEGAALRAKVLGEAAGAAALYPLKPYPVPNSASQVLLALLVGPLGAAGAGKAVAVGVLALGLWAVYRLCVRLHGPEGVFRALVLAATVVVSASYWNGYLNFQLGLAVLALYGAVRARDGLAARPSAPVTAVFGVVLFFCHSVPFLAFALGAGLEALGRRDARLVGALTPAALLSVAYVVGRAGGEAGVTEPFPDLATAVAYKGYTVLKLGPFVHFLRPDGSGTLDGAPLAYAALAGGAALFVAVLGGLLLRGAWRLGADVRADVRAGDAAGGASEARARLAVVGLALGLALLALPIPPVWLSVVNLGERLLSVALLLLVAVVPMPRRALAALALAMVPFLAHDAAWLASRAAPAPAAVEADLARRVARGHERQADPFANQLASRADGAVRFPWFVRNPFDQAAYTLAVERGVWALPLPSTGLVAGTDP